MYHSDTIMNSKLFKANKLKVESPVWSFKVIGSLNYVCVGFQFCGSCDI